MILGKRRGLAGTVELDIGMESATGNHHFNIYLISVISEWGIVLEGGPPINNLQWEGIRGECLALKSHLGKGNCDGDDCAGRFQAEIIKTLRGKIPRNSTLDEWEESSPLSI